MLPSNAFPSYESDETPPNSIHGGSQNSNTNFRVLSDGGIMKISLNKA